MEHDLKLAISKRRSALRPIGEEGQLAGGILNISSYIHRVVISGDGFGDSKVPSGSEVSLLKVRRLY